ncbi:unnamed protein product [Aphanomyces euteiches]|uniref:glucan 1,3-beta-glucosidase n=1 Tax=Aphanomyces euteiches TaxID=100861 RepID=A0A6G0W9A2_9STRA|nr:hypothetical protein Ae201684_017911 [Aphanomyces euteiches]KAH9095183.1 hypothetical protein Ae201684P_015633 [Aphanomyces euteiches]KAH9143585.1 hypothetical protein AeRB84_012431 [Aphanomyces euteiches]
MRHSIAALSSVAAIASAAHIQHDIRAGRVKSRGVNLGGWLVAENWMTTGAVIWQGVPRPAIAQGEYTTMSYWGAQQGTSRFQQHWSTFISEHDIRQISLAKLNTVRVPVGFWIQDCDH